jgi:hypothetical protein
MPVLTVANAVLVADFGITSGANGGKVCSGQQGLPPLLLEPSLPLRPQQILVSWRHRFMRPRLGRKGG